MKPMRPPPMKTWTKPSSPSKSSTAPISSDARARRVPMVSKRSTKTRAATTPRYSGERALGRWRKALPMVCSGRAGAWIQAWGARAAPPRTRRIQVPAIPRRRPPGTRAETRSMVSRIPAAA